MKRTDDMIGGVMQKTGTRELKKIMLKSIGWGKSREQMIIGKSIRSSDEREKKKCYKSDLLIASIVSMEQTQ